MQRDLSFYSILKNNPYQSVKITHKPTFLEAQVATVYSTSYKVVWWYPALKKMDVEMDFRKNTHTHTLDVPENQ